MQTVTTAAAARHALNALRPARRIALAPTMGNLHGGHLALIEAAKKSADHVVVSIFVNPTQFGENEDFAGYPRTPDTDLALLRRHDVALAFIPPVEELYNPGGPEAEVTLPALDSIHCGQYRPGHFKGVATVVLKLFNIIRPDVAVFGEKDYQQLLLIRGLASSLHLPVEVMGHPTVREHDGLALSSRNHYLTGPERAAAPKLYQCLRQTAAAIRQGARDYEKLERQALLQLKGHGFRPDYYAICDAGTLKKPLNNRLVILAAARLGKARLIDNILLQPGADPAAPSSGVCQG